MKPRKSRILIYDIEVTSDVGDSWRKWDTNIHYYRRDWYMLCFAYKWYGEKKIHVIAQPDFELYEQEPYNDYEVVRKLWELFNEADAVVAHNGNSFDQKKAHARMMQHNMQPPEPYKQIDTKLLAKRYFSFTSNKLDDLARYFNIQGKMDTGGYSLWIGCENGDPKAWAKMKRYNKQDVAVLEQVYERFRPWDRTGLNINVIENRPEACPKCGGGHMIAGMKYKATNATVTQYFRCKDCGGMSRVRLGTSIKPKYAN